MLDLERLKTLCAEATPGPWVDQGGYRVYVKLDNPPPRYKKGTVQVAHFSLEWLEVQDAPPPTP